MEGVGAGRDGYGPDVMTQLTDWMLSGPPKKAAAQGGQFSLEGVEAPGETNLKGAPHEMSWSYLWRGWRGGISPGRGGRPGTSGGGRGRV